MKNSSHFIFALEVLPVSNSSITTPKNEVQIFVSVYHNAVVSQGETTGEQKALVG